MLKFAICDDEPFMIEDLSRQLSRYMEAHQPVSYQISRFSDGHSLLESTCDFDVIFLDIQMKGTDGMETARMLRRQNHHNLLIFVTVLKEYVFEAFDVEAFDYLVKPLDIDHFRHTMDRVLKTLRERTEKTIVIQKGASCEIIPLSQIVYCEVQGRKLYLHQSNGKILDYYNKLKDFEQCVDGRFFKCHRSYLVNLEYVRGYNAGQILLSQGEKIPISRLREQDLTQSLLYYMKERSS